jgi:biopolymer transport protein ExbD
MAYKPSMRRHYKPEPMRLDIRPVMNLMVVLIPLLLAGSVWTKLAVKQLNLPPKSAGIGPGELDQPVEIEKRLGLNVIISKQGFYVGTRSGFLQAEENKREEDSEPSVPLTEEGILDYTTLQQKLMEIKERITNTDFVDKNAIMLTAEADIPYKYLIKTMDNVTFVTDENGDTQELFPQIIIGQVIF